MEKRRWWTTITEKWHKRKNGINGNGVKIRLNPTVTKPTIMVSNYNTSYSQISSLPNLSNLSILCSTDALTKVLLKSKIVAVWMKTEIWVTGFYFNCITTLIFTKKTKVLKEASQMLKKNNCSAPFGTNSSKMRPLLRKILQIAPGRKFIVAH